MATSVEIAVTAPTSNELAAMRTDLAAKRNMMAAERSLMAWVRTGMAMISFGFTIYKMLQGFAEAGRAIPDKSPESVGLFLTGMGTLAIVMGSIEFLRRLHELRAQQPFRILRPAFVMAMLMSGAGLVLFGSIIFRIV